MSKLQEAAKEYANKFKHQTNHQESIEIDFIAGANYQFQQQDEFAIGFAEWKDKNCKISSDGLRWAIKGNHVPMWYNNKGLLEIYKNETK